MIQKQIIKKYQEIKILIQKLNKIISLNKKKEYNLIVIKYKKIKKKKNKYEIKLKVLRA